MLVEKLKFGDRLLLKVPIISDQVESFHSPGEEAVFIKYIVIKNCPPKVCCRIQHDTLILSSGDVVPLVI